MDRQEAEHKAKQQRKREKQLSRIGPLSAELERERRQRERKQLAEAQRKASRR